MADTNQPATMSDRKKNWLGCIPARYVFTCLAFLGILNALTIRVNLSVAIVAMVNTTKVENTTNAECPVNNSTDNGVTYQTGEFHWDEYVQGIILGSFSWGYIITQLPAGRLAAFFTAKWTFGVGVLTSAVLSLLTPLAAKTGYWWLIAVRVGEGLGQGVAIPCMHTMISRWSPPGERSRMVSFIFSGILMGTVLGLLASGWLAENGFAGGWPSVFYVFGIIGVVWFVLWAIFAYDSPETHPFISKEEKHYIMDSLQNKMNKKYLPLPWFKVFTSLPMWAIIVSQCSYNWGFYTLLTELPTYLRTILNYDLRQDGLMSALPYFISWVFSTTCGVLCDLLIKRNFLTTTRARKVFQFFGDVLPAACMLGITWTGCDQQSPYALLVLYISFTGATYAGYVGNHIDIAPNYAGNLYAITNAIATIQGWMGPYTVGSITEGKPYRREWNKVFYIAAGINIFSGIFYVIYGSGEEQPWNKLEDEEIPATELSRDQKGANGNEEEHEKNEKRETPNI